MVQKSLDRVYPNTTAIARSKVETGPIGGLDANHMFKITFSDPFILIFVYQYNVIKTLF